MPIERGCTASRSIVQASSGLPGRSQPFGLLPTRARTRKDEAESVSGELHLRLRSEKFDVPHGATRKGAQLTIAEHACARHSFRDGGQCIVHPSHRRETIGVENTDVDNLRHIPSVSPPVA